MEEKSAIKVYIKVNSENNIIDINSDIFIQDLTGWILIDEGYGDRYAHAQGLYLDSPLTGFDGSYNYRYNRTNNSIDKIKEE